MIEFRYSVTEKEFQEAQRLWCSKLSKQLPGRALLLVVAAAAVLLLSFVLQSVPLSLSLPSWLLLIVLYAINRWRGRASRLSIYQQIAPQLTEVQARFDEFGYHDEKPNSGGGWIAWARFQGWREAPEVFLLGLPLTFLTVPKKALSIPEQQELRALLVERIGSETR